MAAADRVLPIAIFFHLVSSLSPFFASAATNSLDVLALESLYEALNAPPQLTGWRISGGDPCDAHKWIGVNCSGDSVVSIQLNGLRLNGSLGSQLSNFLSLKHLDVSFNNIGGEIPYALPPNATYINLAVNNFSRSIPSSLSSLRSLRLLNVSHNSLYGPMGNMFTDMQNLEKLDLSFNYFSGGLPSSFTFLRNLHELYLQNNQFTGSVSFLANLPLSVLYMQENHFSGFIPKQFEFIPQLRINGNLFQSDFSSPTQSLDGRAHPPLSSSKKNISHNPLITSGSYGSSSIQVTKPYWRSLGLGTTAAVGCGVLLVALLVMTVIIISKRRLKNTIMTKDKSPNNSLLTLPVAVTGGNAMSHDQWPMGSPGRSIKRALPVHHKKPDRTSKRKSSSNKCRNVLSVKLFSASELLIATNNYNEGRLLGEGPNGHVFRAEFPDGQVLAVKKINMVALAIHEEDDFLDLIWNISRLRHPNITSLLGYCLEQGQHILVYEYARNRSLADCFFSGDYHKALSWKARVKIALGVAHALEYMHCVCIPPVAHENIKATNILLDHQFMPLIVDYGMAVLRPLIKSKAKTCPTIIGFNGYAAPEQNIPERDKLKSDVYSFGVVLLEILTGRRAFDISRRKEEQILVQWASHRFHDFSLLEDMTDPSIRGTISSQVLSRFADIILLCIQPEPEFRSPITVIVEKLVHLVRKMNLDGKPSNGDASELNASDLSFKSTVAYFDQPLADPVDVQR